jgi:hypothetical protein
MPNADGTESLHIALSLRLDQAAAAGQELVFDYASVDGRSRADEGRGLKFDPRRMSVSLDGTATQFGLRNWLAEGEFVRDNVGTVTRPMVGPPLYFVKCAKVKMELNTYAAVAVVLAGDEVDPDADPATVPNRARSGPIVDAIRQMVYHDDRPVVRNARWHHAYALQEHLEAVVASRPPMQALPIAKIANPNWHEAPLDANQKQCPSDDTEAESDTETTASNDGAGPVSPPARDSAMPSAPPARPTNDMQLYRQARVRQVVAREAYVVELVARSYARRGLVGEAIEALAGASTQQRAAHVSTVVKTKTYKVDVFASVFGAWLQLDADGTVASSRVEAAEEAVEAARAAVASYDRFFPDPDEPFSTDMQLRWQQYKDVTVAGDRHVRTTPQQRVFEALDAFKLPSVSPGDLYAEDDQERTTKVQRTRASAANGLRFGAHEFCSSQQ